MMLTSLNIKTLVESTTFGMSIIKRNRIDSHIGAIVLINFIKFVSFLSGEEAFDDQAHSHESSGSCVFHDRH